VPNDHTTAIVPLQCWAYESPLLRRDRTPIDVGLLAEALIYYDRILLIPVTEVPVAKVFETPPVTKEPARPFDAEWRRSFLQLVEWFVQRDAYAELVALFSDGTLNVYHYAFYTLPMIKSGKYMLWNMQDEEEGKGDETFLRRFLASRDFESIVPKGRHREKLYRALVGRVTEVHASEFDQAVENARVDFVNATAARVAVQSLVDEFRALLPADVPREITVQSIDLGGGDTNLTFNVNLEALGKLLGPLELGIPTPLCGLAHSNRLLWSAATSNCDLYLPTPISRLVNTKLVESNERRTKSHQVIETLEAKIDFPDIRQLVNSSQLSFADVLKIRGKAQRFRKWLQTQAERDRDALLAYHHEVAQASGFARTAGKTLKLFGTLAGAGLGAMAGAAVAGPPGAMGGAVAVGGVAAKVAEEGVRFVFDVAGKLDEEWKPVVFGDWVTQYVNRQ
jgi:hypothetical protein